jgi:hypothetical protein
MTEGLEFQNFLLLSFQQYLQQAQKKDKHTQRVLSFGKVWLVGRQARRVAHH